MDLLKIAQQGEQFSQGDLLASEAEQAIRKLQSFDVSQVGNPLWMSQQEAIEKLNAQAHRNAQQHADEFVVEGLVSFDKLSLLVQELLVFEVWKAKVYPHLRDHFAHKLDSVTAYLVLFHEAGLTNLLEVTLYHQHACEAVSELALVELCDWCHRQAAQLHSLPSRTRSSEGSAKDMLHQSAEQDLQDREREIAFGSCMASLTVLRYISDYITTLPLGIIPRLMRTNDMISALVPLISAAPWMRRGSKGTEKYQGGQWVPVPPAERLRVTQHEVQVWLTIHNLLTEPSCRDHCTFDEHRLEQLQKLRPYLTDILLDQVPVLKNLQLFLDQLVLAGGKATSNAGNSCLIIEQVPSVREALLRRSDWQSIAEQQRNTVFSAQAVSSLDMARLEAFIKSLDTLDEQQLAGMTPSQGAGGEVRVHVWRRGGKDVLQPWTEFGCHLDASKPAEPVSLTLDDGSSVSGTRHRLQAVTQGKDSKPLPGQAKVSVVHGSCSADAWLELPTASTRSAIAELPAVVWVTVGLLAKDGFALQLKLRKGEGAIRDQKAGCWLVYFPAGGAFNLATGSRDSEDASSVLKHPAILSVNA